MCVLEWTRRGELFIERVAENEVGRRVAELLAQGVTEVRITREKQ